MLAAGSRLGPYTILAPLGAGGMGEVYRARDPRLGREVAVKVLPAEVSGDGERLRRFEQEARAASALNHPNILTVFDTGSQDGTVYLVTEVLEGETLRGRLAGGALPARKAIEIGTQIARGLAAAHERGIVHRDLKPENLFLTRDGRVKILDFGLAKLQQSEIAEAPTILTGTEPGVVLGTVGYMAPEQVRGRPADHRADLFAFGAVLYEMLTGRRAFQKDSAAETMSAILREEPPELAVPPGLDRVVRHCLEKEPQHRFQSASDLAFDLESISVLSGTGASPTRAGRRRGWLRAAAAGLLLALAFLAGGLAHREWGRSEPPRFKRLTFRLGNLTNARFAPDGQTIVYSASWDGRLMEIFTTRTDSPESRSLGLPPGTLHSISPRGEMLISLLQVKKDGAFIGHTLARLPLAGGAPRPVLASHYPHWVDWAPGGETFADLHAGDYGARIEYPRGKGIWASEGYAWDLRVAPAGDALAFCEDRGDLQQAVVVTDRGGKVLARSGGWSQVPFFEWLRRGCLAWTPDGREVWFTGARPGEESGLYALTRGGEVRLILRLADDMALFDIAPDGRALLAQVSRRTGIRARAPGEAQERDLSWFESSELADLSADGRWVLFTESGKGGGERMAVYLRRTDGSPAVRLGEGRALALSPDGRWALARGAADPGRLFLLPTGAGEPRALPPAPMAVTAARWLPGGRKLLVGGTLPGKGFQLSVLEIGSDRARPFAWSGSEQFVPSPDGSRVAVWTFDGVKVQPIEGGAPQAMPAGVTLDELPIQWREDGRALYLAKFNAVGRWIDEVDLATGRRRHWKELRAVGPSPSSAILNLLMTPDGQAYAYDVRSILSTLYLVEGLR
jgi:hypothetical protein